MDHFARAYRVLLWTAFLWAAGNCAYVYLVLGGERAYRIETAVLILVALLVPLALAPIRFLDKRFSDSRLPTPDSRLSAPDSRVIFYASALVAALWLAILGPLVTYSFLSDDYVFLAFSRGESSGSWEFFRPLFLTIFSLLARIGGESVVPFHLLAFALHLGAAALVAMLTRRVIGTDVAAVLAFSVFVLNPLQLEAVLWVSGLQEQLWTFFVLAALVCYTGAPVLTAGRVIATMVLAAAGLFSKETAVCFVLLLPAADWMFFGFRRGRMMPAAYGAGAALVLAFAALRLWSVGMEQGLVPPLSAYRLKEFAAMPYQFFVQPWSSAAVAPPAIVPLAAAVAALSLLFAGVLKGGGRHALAGVVVIAAATLPLGTYFFVASDLRHARYLYFPAVGWALLLASLVSRVARRPAVALATTAAYALAAASVLWLNLGPWRTVREVMEEMSAGVRAGRPAAAAAAEWSARTNKALVLRDGIPAEHQGVWILLNGYEEFQAYVRRHR